MREEDAQIETSVWKQTCLWGQLQSAPSGQRFGGIL